MVDLYIAGEDLRAHTMVEDYNSLTWTTRYSAFGEFELETKSSSMFRASRTAPQFLLSSFSSSVMLIETVDMTEQNADGETLVKVKGRSMEAFLAQRSCKAFDSTELSYTMSVPEAMAFIVDRYCIDPVSAGPNKIPRLRIGSVAPATKYTLSFQRSDIYSVVKGLADLGAYGFRISWDNAELVFSVYDGLRRLDPAESFYREYSSDAENFFNPKALETNARMKTVARVHGARKSLDVYAPGFNENSASGYLRRVIDVDAKDVGRNATGPLSDDDNALRYWGQTALAESNNQYTKVVDGEVDITDWQRTYYSLGDIVWTEDLFGNRVAVRITEDVFSVDAGVEKRTPTFTALEDNIYV